MTYPHKVCDTMLFAAEVTAWHYTIGLVSAHSRPKSGTVVGTALDTEDQARAEISRQHCVSKESVTVRRAGEG